MNIGYLDNSVHCKHQHVSALQLRIPHRPSFRCCMTSRTLALPLHTFLSRHRDYSRRPLNILLFKLIEKVDIPGHGCSLHATRFCRWDVGHSVSPHDPFSQLLWHVCSPPPQVKEHSPKFSHSVIPEWIDYVFQFFTPNIRCLWGAVRLFYIAFNPRGKSHNPRQKCVNPYCV